MVSATARRPSGGRDLNALVARRPSCDISESIRLIVGALVIIVMLSGFWEPMEQLPHHPPAPPLSGLTSPERLVTSSRSRLSMSLSIP